MADDQKIQLTVQVNAETGQLEVLGAKFKELGGKAEALGGSFNQVGGEASNLLKSFLPLATAGGIVAFFTNAVKGAEDENEALRRLKFTLESNGESWDTNKGAVIQWAQAVQGATRFSDSEALGALERLARATGSVTQGQKASKLAMDLSVASGQSLASSTEIVNQLLLGTSRSVLQATKEFGSFTDGATTAQGVLDALGKHVGGASEKEDDLTKTTHQTKNAFDDFSKQIGQTMLPAVNFVIGSLTVLIKYIDSIGSAIAAQAAITFHVLEGMGQAIKAVLTGHWREVGAISKQTLDIIKSDVSATVTDIEKTWGAGEQKITAALLQGTNDRLQVSDSARKKLQDDEDKAKAEALQKQREHEQKLLQMEMELEQKLAGLQHSSLAQKITALNAEVAARTKKANSEYKVEADLQKYLSKLHQYQVAETKILTNEELIVKQEAALNVASLAVQTLQTVNALGEKGSSAERTRAIALLALQQAIAIGWAWVNAMKLGPWGAAVAAANTALIVAQFAQGVQQINKSADQEASGIAAIKIDAPVPGIDLGGVPMSGGGSSSGSSFVGSSSGGGGGGGAGTIINVGGIVVNFQADELSLDNVDVVMQRMYEKLRQGTIEGVQLALQFQKTANKNINLAA